MILGRLSRLGMRERIGVGVAAVSLFLLVEDALVVKPLVRAVRTTRSEAEECRVRLRYGREVLRREDVVEAQYRRASERVAKSPSRSEAMSRLLGEVDELAASSGLLLTRREGREPKDTRRLKFCEEYAVDVAAFESEPEALVRFLHGVAGMPGMLRVSRLDIGADKGSTKLRGSMVLTKVLQPAPSGGA
jgi:hypothetical protein